MSRAIATAAFGDRYEFVAGLTVPTQQAYAKRIGASHFMLSSLPAGAPSPHWAKFCIRHLLDEWDEVLWLDSDVAVSPSAPDIFEVADGKLALYPEGDVVERMQQFHEYYGKLRGHELKRPDKQRYYNSGVMVVPRSCARIFNAPTEDEMIFTERLKRQQYGRFFRDQNLINTRLAETGFPVVKLTNRWNLMHVPGTEAGVDWEQRAQLAHFIHYAGLPAYMSSDELKETIGKDLAEWRRMDGEQEEADA